MELNQETSQDNLQQEFSKSEEIAAQMFALYLPKAEAVMATMSAKQLRRLTVALLKWPIFDDYHPRAGSVESQVYSMLKQLNDAKTVLVLSTYTQNLEKLAEAGNQPNKEGETTE